MIRHSLYEMPAHPGARQRRQYRQTGKQDIRAVIKSKSFVACYFKEIHAQQTRSKCCCDLHFLHAGTHHQWLKQAAKGK